MTFSVVIPVYNGAAFLEDAIASALHQTLPADEVLVFVHDSTDDSEPIARRREPFVRVVVENTQLNGGEAWNRAIELARSDYIIFLHADDLLTPDCIKHYRNAVGSRTDVVFGFGLCESIDRSQKSLDKRGYSLMPANNEEFLKKYVSDGICVGTWGVLISKRAFEQCRFRTDIWFALDHEWNFRMAFAGELVGIQETVCFIRKHSGQSSQQTNKDYGKDRRRWFLTATMPKQITPKQKNLYVNFLLRMNADTAFYAFWNGPTAEKLDYYEFLKSHASGLREFLSYAKHNFLRANFIFLMKKMYQYTGTFSGAKILGTIVRLLEDPWLYARLFASRFLNKLS